MGANQSSPGNESRNSRNVSKDEVDKALEKQRQLYEQRMKELLKNQAAVRQQQTTTSSTAGQSGLSGTSTVRVPPQRPPIPVELKINASVEIKKASPSGQYSLGAPSQRPPSSVESLERQRNPYSFTQSNLTGAIQPTAPVLPSTSRTLYPNLHYENSPSTSINNNETVRQSPLGNNYNNVRQSPRGNNNDFVFVNSHFTSPLATPSAPPPPSSPPPASRQRSVTRASAGSETGINCPTCKNRFGVKIFNCVSGHASCLDCRMQARPCGSCGARITQMRNISVEEYVSQFKVSCVNEQEGCKLNFQLGEMDNHLKECPFREIQCLLPGGLCRWKGKLSLLAMHFENFHPSHKGDVDTEMSLELNKSENKQMQLIKIGNFNFVFHLIISESQNKVYIVVQLLGTKFSAAKWTYEIHVYNKGAPRRKYQYSDKCLSNTELLTDLMKENRCAVLPLSYAKTFMNHGAVNYRFFIKKEYPVKGETKRDVSACRRGRGRGRGGYHKS